MNSEEETGTGSLRNAAASSTPRLQMQSDQQLLASILDHTHMLIACLDAAFNFVRVNRAYAQADGKTEDYFPGKNHFDLYPNEENAVIFRQVLTSGAPYFAHARAFEYAGCPERGVSYWDWSLVPTKADNGDITGLVLTLMNVTHLVEARESLRRERDFADSLIRTARVIILVLDQNGNIVRFNPYLEELSGRRLEDVIGKSWFETFIPTAERARVNKLFGMAISGVETHGNCNTILTRQGEERIIQWFDTTLRDARGGVCGLLAVGIDNTELMSSQQDLMLFKSIVRSSSEAIAIADRCGDILFVNEAHDALYGCRQAEASGSDGLDRFIGKYGIPADVGRLIRCGDCVTWEGEACAVDKDGRVFPAWVRLDCACSEAGSTWHYILLSHDITAQKIGEEQRIEEKKRLHEAFIREIHHRIKNHLQGVIGLVRNSMSFDGMRPEGFSGLIGKISAMAGVYDVSARHIGPVLPLSEVLRSVIATVRDPACSRCDIEFICDAGYACMSGDESVPVALVLNELVTNACKHRQPSSIPVRVSMESSGNRVEVKIVNAGVLPAEFSFHDRSRIGMGLSLIHSLLPRDCALLTIDQCGTDVVARLIIARPLLQSPDAGDAEG